MTDREQRRIANQLQALKNAIAETNQDLIDLYAALEMSDVSLENLSLDGMQDKAYRRIRSLNTLNFAPKQG